MNIRDPKKSLCSPKNTAGVSEHGAPVRVPAALAAAAPLPAAVRYNDNVHNHQQRLVNDRPLEIVTGGQVPEDARHQLLDVVVGGFAEQADEGVGAARRLDRPLVLVILPAVGEIPEIEQIFL
jgi:hypothetical protein